ncbi:MAG TPA: MlaD family protein [Thermoleophilaceae bacterium]|jgi:virulence factor Mce-like protein
MARRRYPRDDGASPFKVGLVALLVLALLSWVGLTRWNPFSHPYRLEAVFRSANNLKPRSPVRIAGVDVGKVTKVEPVDSDGGGARVTMEIEDKGLPIHRDATLKVRPRTFLEGNFFVDLQPGSPSSPTLNQGTPIPLGQTATPVQLGQVLTALQADTRSDLQSFLREYSAGLEGSGARGFNRSIRYWAPAYRGAALANQATLGEQPARDLQRVLRGQQRTFAALGADDQSLKGLVTHFNVTAAALAREDTALEASLPALRDVLRVAQPALGSLNDALPSVRAFARDALPGVRSSNPTLAASLPFVGQLRALVSGSELRGLARELRARVPALTRLTRLSVPLLAQNRSFAACSNRVLNPALQSRVPDPDFPANSGRVIQEAQRGFVGLGGESRTNDGNTPFYRIQAVSPLQTNKVRPAAPPDDGKTPPPHRPDVPCETQEPPNLNAPGGPAAEFSSRGRAGAVKPVPLRTLRRLFDADKRRLERLSRKQRRLDALGQRRGRR